MSVCYYPLVFSVSANKCIGANFHPKIHKDRIVMSGDDELYYDSSRIDLT